jgi:hypothetical protein
MAYLARRGILLRLDYLFDDEFIFLLGIAPFLPTLVRNRFPYILFIS